MSYESIKKYVGKSIAFLMGKLAKAKYYIEDKPEILESSQFEDLAPYDEMTKKEGGKYFEALEWALANKKISNIALTGTYGSGKSSILRSFEKLYSEDYKYLKISLASFSPEEQGNDESDNKDDNSRSNNFLNRVIERSILQQIFYKVKPEAIPDSRFKKIYSISRWKIIGFCLFATAWLISSAILFKPSLFNTITFWTNFSKNTRDIVDYIAIPIFFIGFVWLLFKLYQTFNRLSFSKLNIAKGEIELSENIDSSILNKHLDELLYFFEVNDYDVVFIEDIDRYDEIDIFAKLRELNTLLNRSDQVGRPINFVYALRDELFEDKTHRTKFFDFIIPTIPVINSNNSKEKLAEKFSEANLGKPISDNLISDLSLFVDDMRTLKSIYNEYLIYKDKLTKASKNQDKLTPNQDKLLAIIIYKNLHPEDFSDLQHGKGKIFNAFNEEKKNAIHGLETQIESKIENIEKKIDAVENESLESVQELRNLYIGEFFKRIANINHPQVNAFSFKGSQISFEEFIDNDEAFNNFKKSSKLPYWSNGHRQTNFSFGELENQVNSNLTYDERESLIKNKNSDEIERLKEKKEKLRREKDRIESKTLEELLQDNPKEKVLGEKLSENSFLVLLLRNGYIDEQYKDYISFFYEGSLKISDKKFLQNVKSQTSSPFDYELINLDEIFKSLRPRELALKEVLNYDLVNYLLENSNSNRGQLNIILDQLANEKDKSIEFIDGFIKQKPANTPKFIKLLTQKWPEIWQFIENSFDFTSNRKEKYFDLIIRHSEIDDILKIDDTSDRSLGLFISNKEDFIDCYEEDDQINKIQEAISKLSVKFEHLTLPEKESQLFNYIYENDLYQINRYMISLIIDKKSDSEELVKQLESANYSTIKKSNCEQLISYIEKNIVSYVENILLEGDKKLNEEEGFFTELLNNEEISLENKYQLLDKQTIRITDIKSTDSELWEALLSESQVEASWKNLLEFYSQLEKINEPLITFLNTRENYKTLAKTTIPETDFSDDFIRNFLREILLTTNLKEESFKAIIKSIFIQYNELNFNALDENKVQSLVQNELLNLTVTNYNHLKENFSPHHIQLIENNIDSFIDRFEEFNVDEEDLKTILNEPEINDSKKLEIFESFDISQLKLDSNLADLSIETLLANQPHQISYQVCKRLVDEGKSKPQKIKLITSQLEFYSRNQSRQLILSLSYPHKRMVKHKNRPKLRKKGHNIALIRKLKKHGVISTFDAEGNRIKVNAKEWRN